MNRLARFRTVTVFLSLDLSLFTLASTAAAAGMLPPMHRGINTFPWIYRARTLNNDSQAFDFPNLFPYFSAFHQANFEALHRAGADFIRVPVEPSPFLAANPEERTKLISIVLEELRKVTSTGMTAVLDLHPREAVPAWKSDVILSTPDLTSRYQVTLVELAKAIVQSGNHQIVLELMNEPPGGYGWHDRFSWLTLQATLVKAVRAVAPSLPVVVTGDRGGGIEGLLRLDPATIDDPAIIYSFHYYEPTVLTHQGAKWTSKAWRQYMDGIPYPPAPADPGPSLKRVHDAIFDDTISGTSKQSVWSEAQAALRDYYKNDNGIVTIKHDFARVSAWAKEHRIPASRIVLGEFGIFRPGASLETDVNYTHDVRKSAEDAGFAWAYFNYTPFDETKQAFSILRMTGPAPNEFDPDIVQRGLGWKMP
jgi:endoglucanase